MLLVRVFITPGTNLPKAAIDIWKISGHNGSGFLATPVYYYYYQTYGVTPALNKNTINIADFYGPNSVGAIKPSDALAIDTKIDDGAPNTGYVRGIDTINIAGINFYCLTGAVGGGSAYDVNNDSTKKCISSFAME